MLLQVLEVAQVGGVVLAGPLAEQARTAMWATAARERVDEHILVECIRHLDPELGDLTLEWIWKRLAWLGEADARSWNIETLPSQLAQSVHAHATPQDLARILRMLECASDESLATFALIELLEWMDPGAPAITEALVRLCKDPTRKWLTHRLLGLERMSWDACETRARTLVEECGDGQAVADLVDAMLPKFWSGSRVGHLRIALEQVEGWAEKNGSRPLQRAVAPIVEDLRRQVVRERETERREDELAAFS